MNDFLRLFRAYGGIGRGSLFFCYRWLVFSHHLVSEAIPKEGLIYDLGCGYGIFSVYLALQHPGRRIVAVDSSERRIRSGRRAADALGLGNISFVQDDILRMALQPAQGAILNDVLHHLPARSDQRIVLTNVCAALRPGGRLIVVDVAPGPRWKHCLGWLVDNILYFGDNISYPQADELRSMLEAHGVFDFSVHPIHAGRPYANVLYTAAKK
ncbi:MAG: class I SAM-dependent methyltransferase [Elusimicrobia bacterium]|nr:class I SAM-dependent methyltransferase [Elusimicrobiota bacterium]